MQKKHLKKRTHPRLITLYKSLLTNTLQSFSILCQILQSDTDIKRDRKVVNI